MDTTNFKTPREWGTSVCLPYIGITDIKYKKIK